MQAIHATRFGDPSVLEVVELPDPVPGPGQLTIDVSHSAVGLIDLFFRQGVYRDVPGMPQPPFVPGLEVTGTVRELGDSVTGFSVGEQVVSMSSTGIGGYASIYVANAGSTISIDGCDLDPALAVSVIPNAAMAHVALTRVANLQEGESVLIHGALGGFPAAFPGIARRLGASRVVGSVRSSKLEAASSTKLPYDKIVDSARLAEDIGDEKFDVIVDAVGGELRTESLSLLRPGGRMIVAGNASGDWGHTVDTNQLWLGSVAVLGFNAGVFLPAHPEAVRPALEAARAAVAAGLGETEVDTIAFSEAASAHARAENRAVNGRIVLSLPR
jgi:NADPH2:quinone reductase